MTSTFRSRLPELCIRSSVVGLSVLGIVMVFSASASSTHLRGDPFFFAKRHLFYCLVGYLLMVAISHCDVQPLKRLSRHLGWISVFLIMLVYVPGLGYRVNGANRWIHIAHTTAQPSALAVLGLILYLARSLAAHRDRGIERWSTYFCVWIMVSVCCFLLVTEPDYVLAFTLCLVALAMLYISGGSSLELALVAMVIWAAASVTLLNNPWAIHKLEMLPSAWLDRSDAGYQSVECILAMGSGGWGGLGLFGGVQKLGFLPNAYADTIFAVIGEELGFVGCVLVMGLYSILVAGCFGVMRRCKDDFGVLVVSGFLTLLGVQAFLSTAGMVGVFPQCGASPPFLGFGGSRTISYFIALGVVVAVHRSSCPFSERGD